MLEYVNECQRVLNFKPVQKGRHSNVKYETLASFGLELGDI